MSDSMILRRALVALVCVMVLSVWGARPSYADWPYFTLGRIRCPEKNETAYIAKSMEALDQLVGLRKATAKRDDLTNLDPDEHARDSVEAERCRLVVIEYIKKKELIAVEQGALILRFKEADWDTLEGDIDAPIEVIIISGTHRGKRGFTFHVGSISPGIGERCFIYPSDKYAKAFGAFSDYSLESMWDDLYKGDKKGAAFYLAIEQAFALDPGTQGYIVDADGIKKQVRITSGKHKGKLLWFYTDSIYSVDMKTIETSVKTRIPLKDKRDL